MAMQTVNLEQACKPTPTSNLTNSHQKACRSFGDTNGQYQAGTDTARAPTSNYHLNQGLRGDPSGAMDPLRPPSNPLNHAALFGEPLGDPPGGLSDLSRPHANPLNPYGGGMGGMSGGMGGLGGGMGGGGVEQGRTTSGNSVEELNQGMGVDGDNQMDGGGPEDSIKQRERNRSRFLTLPSYFNT